LYLELGQRAFGGPGCVSGQIPRGVPMCMYHLHVPPACTGWRKALEQVEYNQSLKQAKSNAASKAVDLIT